ncbi:hypothetical protein PoB_007611400 [Plakobranchus ocellatus]|uniref:Uncharacterized protein n=1 Tax=Plakobranchus ocellatus TaxID=259542 RepID=A0AAV4DZY1_9GAST|nr:hypothetical protein PoB_007611400 [Plakobranchus ocellatus]
MGENITQRSYRVSRDYTEKTQSRQRVRRDHTEITQRRHRVGRKFIERALRVYRDHRDYKDCSHNNVISGFSVPCQARLPVAGIEPTAEDSCRSHFWFAVHFDTNTSWEGSASRDGSIGGRTG